VSTVKIPGIKIKGTKAAVASGIVLRKKSLNMFRDFNQKSQKKVNELLNNPGRPAWYKGFTVNREGLYIESEIVSADERLRVIIEGKHDFIQSINYNGKTIFKAENNGQKVGELFINGLEDIKKIADEIPQILIKRAKHFLSEHGKNVKKYGYENYRQGVKDLTIKRMEGESVTIPTITGSGNQGIFIGVPLYMLYEKYGDDFLPAALFSIMIQIYLASEKGRISGICGLANKAALSLTAGLTYSKGLNLENIYRNMEYVDDTLRGMVCEGAKKSCALKAAVSLKAVEEVIDEY
jgi:L-cysteine desulfidase